MYEQKLLRMIQVFREEFAKISPEEQKYEQEINSLKAPCQIYLLTSKDSGTHLLFISHFPEIPDKTIEIIHFSTTGYVQQIEQFEKGSQWVGQTPANGIEQSGNLRIHSALVEFGRGIRLKLGLALEFNIDVCSVVSNNMAAWHIYGNLDEINFESKSKEIVQGYKAEYKRTKADQIKKEPEQITESIANSINGLGTYFYPPILVGEIKPTLQEEIENTTFKLLKQKALIGEFDGIKFVVSKGGLIGLESIDHERAENIFNIITGTAILMGLHLHTLKSHEIANISIDKITYSVTASSWTDSTYRMNMFDSYPYNTRYYQRTKITTKDLEIVIEKAKTLSSKGDQLNKVKLLAGAFTHLDNHEFSQSFIMSWTIIEIHIHELWTKKIQFAGVTKKIKEDLDRWDFYRVLEVLHLDKMVLNDDYYELKYLSGLRNDIIHDGHEVTPKQALRCYDLAKTIVRNELKISLEIKGTSIYLEL